MAMMGIGADSWMMRRVIPALDDISRGCDLIVSVLAQLSFDPNLVDVQSRAICQASYGFVLGHRATDAVTVADDLKDQPRIRLQSLQHYTTLTCCTLASRRCLSLSAVCQENQSL